jgi:hypothetical protein
MDYLIIIAIVAVALLLTGLTNFDALRRPFRSKTARSEQMLGRPQDGPSTDPSAQSDKRPVDGRQNS